MLNTQFSSSLFNYLKLSPWLRWCIRAHFQLKFIGNTLHFLSVWGTGIQFWFLSFQLLGPLPEDLEAWGFCTVYLLFLPIHWGPQDLPYFLQVFGGYGFPSDFFTSLSVSVILPSGCAVPSVLTTVPIFVTPLWIRTKCWFCPDQ